MPLADDIHELDKAIDLLEQALKIAIDLRGIDWPVREAKPSPKRSYGRDGTYNIKPQADDIEQVDVLFNG